MDLVVEKSYRHKSQVIKNDQVKRLWDFNIQTDRFLEAIKPHVTVVDTVTRKYLRVDAAVPADHNIKVEEIDRINTYVYWRSEVATM